MSPRHPPVIMYHAISRQTRDPDRVCVTPERFEAQMSYLARRGLRGVAMRELTEATDRGEARGMVGLTFDDGYEDFYDTALPTLERHGFSATVFVLGGLPGGENVWDRGPRMRLLSESQILEIAGRGVEIGSHGLGHVGMAGLEAEALRAETAESRRLISRLLGEPVRGFCYPYGALDEEAVRAVREAGYSYACAYKPGQGRASDDDPYRIPRIHAGQADGPARLALKLRGVGRYVDSLRSLR